MFSFLLLIILYSPPYSRSAWLREGRVARAPAGDVWTSSAVLLDPHTFILTSVTTLRGHPHGKAFLRKRTCFASSCGRRILSMMPISHPSTSSLQPLNPATSHNINNKNGGLHTRAAEDIESFLQLTGIVVEYDHSSSSTLLSVHTNASGFLALAIFIFFLLCLVYCLFVYHPSFMRILHLFFYVFGEFQAPLIGLECELQRFESLSMDLFGRKYSWNDLGTSWHCNFTPFFFPKLLKLCQAVNSPFQVQKKKHF